MAENKEINDIIENFRGRRYFFSSIVLLGQDENAVAARAGFFKTISNRR